MNLCQRAEHSAERLLREMSPILWLPGGGNMGIVDIHYGQLHWTRHSQAQSTSHVSRALQVSLINSLLSKLCFQMTFMGLIVILKNWLPKLWRHTPESIQEKMAGTFILFHGTCYFWCHAGGWTLHGKGKIYLWKTRNGHLSRALRAALQAWTGRRNSDCRRCAMYGTASLQSRLFYLMSPSWCSSGLLGTQRALHHSLCDVTFTLQT